MSYNQRRPPYVPSDAWQQAASICGLSGALSTIVVLLRQQ
jgi:hypothetical protein